MILFNLGRVMNRKFASLAADRISRFFGGIINSAAEFMHINDVHIGSQFLPAESLKMSIYSFKQFQLRTERESYGPEFMACGDLMKLSDCISYFQIILNRMMACKFYILSFSTKSSQPPLVSFKTIFQLKLAKTC